MICYMIGGIYLSELWGGRAGEREERQSNREREHQLREQNVHNY